MIVNLNKRTAVAAVAALFVAASAQAQTTNSNQNKNRQPPAADTRPGLPGWMFTPFPINGAGANPPKMNPPMNVKPLNGPGAGIGPIDGGTTVIYQPGYYGYYGYPAYPYAGGETAVIVNQNPVTYPVGNWAAGQGGYSSTPPTVTVVQTDASGHTRMSTSTLFAGCAFPGYTTSFISGRTVYSPFAAYAGCPRYVFSRYVVLGASYPYLNGRDTNTVILPWSANDPYVIADANRGRSLGTALADFSRFWEQGNAAGLRRRIQPDVPVAVFDGERLVYSLRRVDFLALAADALDQIETASFRFTDIRERSDGLVTAYARHTYRSREDGTTHTVQVRYTLVYLDGEWYLSATSITPGTP